MKKRLTYIIFLLLITTGVWYFFIKEYDYLITFKTTNAPGVVYHKLLHWNEGDIKKIGAANILEKEPFSKVTLEISNNNSNTLTAWYFERVSDSVTKVSVYLKDPKNSLSQKVSILFGKTDFVKKNIKIVKRIRTELEAHTTKYRVSTPIEDMIPERYCACTSSSTTITLKAAEMMIQNQKLTDFLAVNGLSVTEYPLLKVTRWNHNSQEIDFDFCFPVPKNKTYPKFEGVTLKNIPKENALKTIFNGNYIISDRGWYTLIDYAQRKKIAVSPFPIELYYNDPHSGTDEMTWKTEIFFPLANENKSKKAAYHD